MTLFCKPICLSKLKQKKFWQNELGNNFSKYKNDYLVALFIHAISWLIMISLPWVILKIPINETVFMITIFINSIIHAVTDHFKANKLAITLLTDQLIHFFQILITMIIFVNSAI